MERKRKEISFLGSWQTCLGGTFLWAGPIDLHRQPTSYERFIHPVNSTVQLGLTLVYRDPSAIQRHGGAQRVTNCNVQTKKKCILKCFKSDMFMWKCLS
jgi:hypothetical protein